MSVIHIRCHRLRRHLCGRTLQLRDVVKMASTASPSMLVTRALGGTIIQIWRGPMGVLLLVGWTSTTPTFRVEAKLCSNSATKKFWNELVKPISAYCCNFDDVAGTLN